MSSLDAQGLGDRYASAQFRTQSRSSRSILADGTKARALRARILHQTRRCIPSRTITSPRTASRARAPRYMRSLALSLRSGTFHWNAPTYPLHHVKQHRGFARTRETLRPALSRATPTRVASDIVASFDPLDPSEEGSKSPSSYPAGPPTATWWRRTGLNRRPPACKAGALPLSYAPEHVVRPCPEKVVGPGRFELPTSRLSSARSNQLSYEPECSCVFADREGRDAPAAAGSRSPDRSPVASRVFAAALIVAAGEPVALRELHPSDEAKERRS